MDDVSIVADYLRKPQDLTQPLIEAQKSGNVTQLVLLLLCGVQPTLSNNRCVCDIPTTSTSYTQVVSVWEDYNKSKISLAIRYAGIYEQLLFMEPDVGESARLVTKEVAEQNKVILDQYLVHNSPELPKVTKVLSRQKQDNVRGTGLQETVYQAMKLSGKIQEEKISRQNYTTSTSRFQQKATPLQQSYDQWSSLLDPNTKVKPSILEACLDIYSCSVSVLYVNDMKMVKRVDFIRSRDNNIVYFAFDGRTFHAVIETPTPVPSKKDDNPLLVLYYLIENNLTDESSFRDAFNSIPNLSDVINTKNVVKFPTFQVSCTVFYFACRSGRVDLVRILLTVNGLNINGPQIDSGDTPLHVANYRGYYNIVLILLYGGANINAVNNKGEPPHLYKEGLETSIKGSLDILWADIRSLGLQKFRDRYGAKEIEHEVQRDPFEYCFNLLTSDKTPNEQELNKALLPLGSRVNEPSPLGSTLLFTACRNGHYMAVKRILECEGIDMNGSQSSDGSSPLHVASWRGHVSIIALLLLKDAKPEPNPLKNVSPADEYKENDKLGAKRDAITEVYNAYKQKDTVLLDHIANKADVNLQFLATYSPNVPPPQTGGVKTTVVLHAFFDAKEEIPPQYARLKNVWFRTVDGGRKLLPLHVCSRLDRALIEVKDVTFKQKVKIFEPPPEGFFSSSSTNWGQEEWEIDFVQKTVQVTQGEKRTFSISWEPTPPILYFKPIHNQGPCLPFDFQTCYKVQMALNDKKQTTMITTYLEEQNSLIRKLTSKPSMCLFNFGSKRVSITQDKKTEEHDVIDMTVYDEIANLHQKRELQTLLRTPTVTTSTTRGGGGGPSVPAHLLQTNTPWSQEVSLNTTASETPLSPDSKEYKNVEESFHLTVPRQDASGKRNRIIAIIKRSDPMKRRIWLAKLEASLAKTDSLFREKNEFVKFLWHGTGGTHPNVIAETGWKINFSSAKNLWGSGTYFATDADYSAGYAFSNTDLSKSIFLAEVIVGAGLQCLENRKILIAPGIYDTIVGYRHGSWIYVCYDNDVAFPTYLVTWNTKK